MAWAKNSPRRKELPPDWPAIRRATLERDGHRCQWPLTFGGKCGRPANEVDHRRGPHDHRMASLWSLCHEHHQAKTQAEARAARPSRVSRRRQPEQHPGRL